MAHVRLTYTYPDGTEVEAVEDSFPDCVDEARAQAVRALVELTGITAQEIEEGQGQ